MRATSIYEVVCLCGTTASSETCQRCRDLALARSEQLRCVRQLAEGHPEVDGLKLGMADNFTEDLILSGLMTDFGVTRLEVQKPKG